MIGIVLQMDAERLNNPAHQRAARPRLLTKGVPISGLATVQVDGLVCMRSHGRSRNMSYPVPRVVQGDNHRRRRGAARRLDAGGGSGGLPRRQCWYVDLGDITTTVRSPYSPQSARTAAYHRQLCSIGNWAHGGGTVAAKCSINRRCRRTTTPHLHTKGVPISR